MTQPEKPSFNIEEQMALLKKNIEALRADRASLDADIKRKEKLFKEYGKACAKPSDKNEDQ